MSSNLNDGNQSFQLMFDPQAMLDSLKFTDFISLSFPPMVCEGFVEVVFDLNGELGLVTSPAHVKKSSFMGGYGLFVEGPDLPIFLRTGDFRLLAVLHLKAWIEKQRVPVTYPKILEVAGSVYAFLQETQEKGVDITINLLGDFVLRGAVCDDLLTELAAGLVPIEDVDRGLFRFLIEMDNSQLARLEGIRRQLKEQTEARIAFQEEWKPFFSDFLVYYNYPADSHSQILEAMLFRLGVAYHAGLFGEDRVLAMMVALLAASRPVYNLPIVIKFHAEAALLKALEFLREGSSQISMTNQELKTLFYDFLRGLEEESLFRAIYGILIGDFNETEDMGVINDTPSETPTVD